MLNRIGRRQLTAPVAGITLSKIIRRRTSRAGSADNTGLTGRAGLTDGNGLTDSGLTGNGLTNRA